MYKKLFFQLFALFFLLSFSVAAYAEDLKAGFRARKPTIDSLKDRGIVGENNRGFLEFVGPNKEGVNIIQEDNAARGKVYNQIGQRTGSAPDEVGRQRSLQIINRAKKGHILQDPSGRRFRK